ncbi:HNH endonuclease [Streptomyces sp. NPDC090085]|uniref:HNH endonuclease n=1 Tax=Streptomyces sp. NPDC090085 TaxID=3365943 RepID=UPI003821F727
MRSEVGSPSPQAITRPRRRYFRLWEELAVLTAHRGLCIYCLASSEVKDHVIPFARGGDDALHNLAPACDDCNDSKNDRTPLEFAAFRLSPGVWGRHGHPGSGQLVDEFDRFRRSYPVWMERIEITQIELLNRQRREWFRNDVSSTYFSSWPQPTIRVKAAIYRHFYGSHVAAAEKAGWPTESSAPFRILRPRDWHARSERPSDWVRL